MTVRCDEEMVSSLVNSLNESVCKWVVWCGETFARFQIMEEVKCA